MNAGQTTTPVGTRIRVVSMIDNFDREYLGVEGFITHPFRHLIYPAFEDGYICGVYQDDGHMFNLKVDDVFEVVA